LKYSKRYRRESLKTKYLIFASQDYDKANHKGLWDKLANELENDVVVVNIPADKIVSRVKGHADRIADARAGAKKYGERLTVIRPMLTLRAELVPKCLYKSLSKELWRDIEEKVPDIKDCFLNVIVYNAFWVEILKKSRNNMKIAYYLFDEVRRNGNDNSINKRRYAEDEFACRNSDVVFTMTRVLAESRKEYNDNIIVMGNGADLPEKEYSGEKYTSSAAFVGNFRNWVDKKMLKEMISSMPEILFVFVGSVEEDMREYLDSLLKNYPNTLFYGKVPKAEINSLYSAFDCVIIPYLDSEFIRATRPIKIVESVLAGTPVVTVPMDGYDECEFIRFAKDAEEFSREIRYCVEHAIDRESREYKSFVENNTWSAKAKQIDAVMKKRQK